MQSSISQMSNSVRETQPFNKRAKAWNTKFKQQPIVEVQVSQSSFILTHRRPMINPERPLQLRGFISIDEYQQFIEDLNKLIIQYWPPKCFAITSYVLVPVTIGFSLLAPIYCLNQVEKYLSWKIEEYNIDWEHSHFKCVLHKGKLLFFTLRTQQDTS
ncbi:hypothetical protein pb186bvf_000068 [Paramecium bursaria]